MGEHAHLGISCFLPPFVEAACEQYYTNTYIFTQGGDKVLKVHYIIIMSFHSFVFGSHTYMLQICHHILFSKGLVLGE